MMTHMLLIKINQAHCKMSLNRRRLYILLLLWPPLLISCAGLYFHDAGKPPSPPPQFELRDWPYQEYWTGIVFNGAKIGFSHFTLLPDSTNPDVFDTRSEAAMHFRFLNFDKKILLRSHDRIASDLSLVSFDYDYDLDGNLLTISGHMTHDGLETKIITNDQEFLQNLPVKNKIYPTSIIGLFPLMHGLQVGRTYTYPVYDGETRSISPVEQKVLAFEQSKLFAGQAFKIRTRLHGHEVLTWMDIHGRPLLEISMGGVIIAELESKSTALKYLAQAAVNKAETLLDFSLIKSDIPVHQPENVRQMEVALAGMNHPLKISNDHRQECRRQDLEMICRIRAQAPNSSNEHSIQDPVAGEQYLQPSLIIPSNNPRIRKAAKEIVTTATQTDQQIRLLLDWIHENIEQEPVDVFSALDVLNTKKAECQGHAFLYAAFARALDIPTRVVNGIVYSSEYKGFLYHTWVESLEDGAWIAIDPTFRQMPADATHVKLVEGENISDLIPLVDLIGKIKLRIIQIDTLE